MSTTLRIAFAGTSDFAAHILQELVRHEKSHDCAYTLVAVLTTPDTRSKRGLRIQESAVKQLYARARINTPLYQPQHSKDASCYEQLCALDLDVLVVAAYGIILSQQWLNTPRYGCINIHASLLPRWRGSAPIERTIMEGDKRSGITIMQMDSSVDGGDILAQKTCTIGSEDGAGALEHKLRLLSGPALFPVLNTLATKGAAGLKPKSQKESEATHAPKIQKHEHVLDWEQDAQWLEQRVRALDQRGYARMHIATSPPVLLKVTSAQQVPYVANAAAGSVLVADEGGILIACAKNALLLKCVQLPDKPRPMDIPALRHGHRHWFEQGGIFSVGTVMTQPQAHSVRPACQ